MAEKEKKNLTVQELIDLLSEVKNKNIPISISVGDDMQNLVIGDNLSIKRVAKNAATEEGKEDVDPTEVLLVTGGEVNNELTQIMKIMSPQIISARIGTAFTKFLCSETFFKICHSSNIIMTACRNRLGGKMSERDKARLVGLRNALNLIIGNDVVEEK